MQPRVEKDEGREGKGRRKVENGTTDVTAAEVRDNRRSSCDFCVQDKNSEIPGS